MAKIIVKKSNPLKGKVKIDGAKNEMCIRDRLYRFQKLITY